MSGVLGDLLARLRDPDANRRIAAARSVEAEGWTQAEKDRLVAELLGLLGDEAHDDYCYGCWQFEEDELAVRVCEEARDALLRLTTADRSLATYPAQDSLSPGEGVSARAVQAAMPQYEQALTAPNAREESKGDYTDVNGRPSARA